ncbi:MAG: N-acetylmuramoyl-L-alanine amidase [Calditrichaeota bacterium]|nr:N-acetylmuramoyl-L-alanine amidase [Calditrichota bacterium]
MNKILLLLLFSAVLNAQPHIDVVYPRAMPPDTIAYIDDVNENFIFGSVTPPNSVLRINGIKVELLENGSFLAFLPVDWENSYYELTATAVTSLSIDSANFYWQSNVIVRKDSSSIILPFTTRSIKGKAEQPDISFPTLVTLNGGVARTAPNGAYYLFPDKDTQVIATGWRDNYYRFRIAPQQSVWVASYYCSKFEAQSDILPPVIWEAQAEQKQGWDELKVPLGRKVLYRIYDETFPNKIIVDLFGVISHLDKISYSSDLRSVWDIVWSQPADEVVRLEINLMHSCWGYKVDWSEDGQFILSVKNPPEILWGIKGLHVAIDPGHGGDKDGAIGPTRLTEKEINLKIAGSVVELLDSKGVQVTQTRTDDSDIGLKKRIHLAENAGADLLISLHHNALADGTNPFGDFGTGTHYYHPFSRDFAISVQRELIQALMLHDEGVYYNNLALARPTAMPSILVESAYIMFPDHEMMMLSEDYPAKIAKAIYLGVKEFVTLRKKSL